MRAAQLHSRLEVRFLTLIKVLDFAQEVMDNEFAGHKRAANWKRKFGANAMRMIKSYNKCGNDPVVAPVAEWISYDNSKPSKAMKDITTGFRKWAQTYLNSCKGQYNRNHIAHISRMTKWNSALTGHASVSHLN